jgi:hypothetical protein
VGHRRRRPDAIGGAPALQHPGEPKPLVWAIDSRAPDHQHPAAQCLRVTPGASDSKAAQGHSSPGPGPAMAIVVAIIRISWGLSGLIRFALSRARGISGRRWFGRAHQESGCARLGPGKIDANARFDAPREWRRFSSPTPSVGAHQRLFSTPPSIAARIEALRREPGSRSGVGRVLIGQQAIRRCA